MKTWLVVAVLLLSTATATVAQVCPPDSKTCRPPTPINYVFRVASGNPAPWSTVVRITANHSRALGIGSGTIIDGNPDSALVMTCAHVLSIPRSATLTVEIFGADLGHPQNCVGPPIASFAAEAVDRDDSQDVGLIRFRPGRLLAASPLVPPGWTPSAEPLCSMGCSMGANPTALASRFIRTSTGGTGLLSAYRSYECEGRPAEGRSGGGLFDENGRLIGVCDLASLETPVGFYARVESLRAILLRNGLVQLSEGAAKETQAGGFSLKIGGRVPQAPAPAAPAPRLPAIPPPPENLVDGPSPLLGYVGTAIAGGAMVGIPALLAWLVSRARRFVPTRPPPSLTAMPSKPSDVLEALAIMRVLIESTDAAEAREKENTELLVKIRALFKGEAPQPPKDGSGTS